MKSFGELFSKSWNEYKPNFKTYSKIILLFVIIPSIVMFIAGIPFTLHINNLDITKRPNTFEVYKPELILPLFFVGIIAFLVNLFGGACLIYNSVYKKENKTMSFKESLSGGKKYYWKFAGFGIVTFFFIFLLYLLLIIPGIIFSVFWVFSGYILIKENTGIKESLKKSYSLVRGNWWRTFGYLLLLFLIFIAVAIGIGLIFGIINFTIEAPYIDKAMKTISTGTNEPITSYPPKIIIITSLIGQISSGIINLITIPFMIFFLKNFYLDMKEGKKREGKI